jgi:hypothetical protein
LSFGITTAFIAFVIAAGGAPECTLLSPRIWLATLLAAAAFSAMWRLKFSLAHSWLRLHFSGAVTYSGQIRTPSDHFGVRRPQGAAPILWGKPGLGQETIAIHPQHYL